MKALGTVVVLAVVLLGASQAQAWIVTQIDPVADSNLVRTRTILLQQDSNVAYYEIHKYFQADPPVGLVTVKLNFQREAGDANTIVISDELIYNLMTGANGRTWTDFHVLLDCNPFTSTIRFIDPNGARAWQTYGGAPRLGFTPSSYDDTEVAWLGTSQPVPAGAFGDPNAQLVLSGLQIDASGISVGESFLLKEWPSSEVPEPASLLALGAGAVLMMARRRSKRKAMNN